MRSRPGLNVHSRESRSPRIRQSLDDILHTLPDDDDVENVPPGSHWRGYGTVCLKFLMTSPTGRESGSLSCPSIPANVKGDPTPRSRR